MMKSSILLLFIISLLGCKAELKDVSEDPIYSETIGSEFISKKELLIHAITHDQNYKKVIGSYNVTIKPGFGGPEVIFQRVLPKGMKIKVTHIKKCVNCIPRYIEAVIDLSTTTKYQSAPVYIWYERLTDSTVFNKLKKTHNK